MPDKELDSIKKLSPEERVKKLNDLSEKRRKEKENMEKLLEDSISEIVKDENLKNIKVPVPEKVNVEKLFEKEEESPDDLEKKAAEARESDSKANQPQYKVGIEEAENIYERVKSMGYTDSWEEKDFRDFYNLKSFVEKVDINALGDDVARKIKSTVNIIDSVSNYIK